ncbi:MAG: hypothetical protein JXA93_13670 [Anaerolineae bacterium]|nr:hypothetical protein [Anaerolineae bacterium]
MGNSHIQVVVDNLALMHGDVLTGIFGQQVQMHCPERLCLLVYFLLLEMVEIRLDGFLNYLDCVPVRLVRDVLDALD